MRPLLCALASALVAGCPAPDPGAPPPDVGPRRDAAGDDAGGDGEDGGALDAPGLDDVGPPPDAGPPPDGAGADGAVPADAPRISMPCMASGTCDPFVAGSCATGEGCLLGATGTACTTLDATIAAEGEVCTRPNGCEPGTACLSFAAEGFRCHRMCPEGSIGFCGAAATCSGTLGDACVQVCRPLPVRCDIYAQDCADPTHACTLVQNPETDERYTGCRIAGTNAEGAPCGGGMGACSEGLVCVTLSGTATCHRVCREDGSPPVCTLPGETCIGRSGGWGVTFCRTPPMP